MASKKLYIETHGCQMNVDDSLRMSRSLAPSGYERTENPQEADLIVINTCSVREKASHKAHSAIGRFYQYKALRPEVMLGLAGCQAQAEGEGLLKRFKYLDFVLGPDQIRRLPELVKEMEEGKRSLDATGRIKPADFEFVDLTLGGGETTHSAFVTIMKGCDNFCSFCIVPFVRGREVSRPSDEIVSEIRELCRHGVKEVTLLGQNVNSYGTKNTGEISFSRLLRRIADETDLKRLRFTTSHPKDVGEDLAEAFRDIPILAKHLHLPIQSGSNRVLEKMYRTYTREEYLRIVERLRKACPDLALTTDLIVGFPGETEESFGETLSLLDEVRFDAAYSFVYSPRPHTTAGRYFADDVPSQVKENRLRFLQEKQLKISFEENEKCVGRSYEVLIEGPSKIGESFQGRTPQNRIVHWKGAFERRVGEMVKVKVTRATPSALVGEVEGEAS
ncbi:MAG: tRNA (N6-isopentenyl adenosine(37)-C2)-methylthiotransferase MiaB [bacterium]